MPPPSFLSCAEQYARSWSSRERPIFEGLASLSRSQRLAALQKGAGYFRIARSFNRRFDVDRGIARLAPVLDALEPYRTSRLVPSTLCPTIAALRLRLGHDYGGKDLLSAATKLLWLLRREPAIIYDSQARRALSAPAGDYGAYMELWLKGYRKNELAIRQACSALPGQGTDPVLLSQDGPPEWFRQRVYDIYLWRVGARAPT